MANPWLWLGGAYLLDRLKTQERTIREYEKRIAELEKGRMPGLEGSGCSAAVLALCYLLCTDTGQALLLG